MYYNFINLNDVSPVLREAVEDIQMILINEWIYEEKLENDRMLKLLTNSDYLLAEVMSLEGEDDRAVTLLQMAVCRFCKIHFKEILKSKRVPWLIQNIIKGGSYEEYDYFEFYVGDEIKKGFKKWEYEFWFYDRGCGSLGARFETIN